MRKTSAALLAYRIDAEREIHVFLGHMGGPYWARKDDGGWSIPKGEYDAAQEAPQDVARREFGEEIGREAPPGELLDLGECVQPSGKRIRTFAVEAAADLDYISSNTFDLEWPRGSGTMSAYPEIDRAAWFTLQDARRKVVPGQVPILDELRERLDP